MKSSRILAKYGVGMRNYKSYLLTPQLQLLKWRD